LEALSGPDGLTGQVSTFTRAEVVDAVAKRLPVARSAQEARDQVEAAADRFLDERTIRVARDKRLGDDRFSTPELLTHERLLVDSATQRTGEGCAVVRPDLVRQVLDRHTSVGEDQAAMIQDLTQGGAGVAVVVGRAGSGKTWALGLAREAFELDGYQVHGTAPTGIATVGLADEGYTDARTVDRLLLDLAHGRVELDRRSVLVVDEAAMVATRKLAPLLGHAERAGAKVVLVGDDRQFASIAAGGGFRALRLRLGASELTVNRRQVEAWEQQAIDDVRAGSLERAVVAYAEHDRIRAFEARDDRDRALVNDWWQAHEAGERPVIYAHRRAQVDQLNQVCQRLRAEAGQLGPERLTVGDRSFGVGDVVVLGANARDRLGVVNGTTAVIQELNLRRRSMTVQTLEEELAKTVRLPGWYLDALVRPGQSRRVDLAYARTDMRSQGRTERRALLALDGAEDMQGGYVQLTRSKQRTDLYLTVGPEPLGPDEERPYPAQELRAPEELLARVLTRDGSKTLASDTPDLLDVRRLSTRQLRAERDRLAQLRATCPPDRSRELRLATRRAAEAEEARQHARADQQAAAEQVAALTGSWRHRGERAAARERLALAQHALRTTTGQADQAAERLGLLRRAQQRHLGWMEAHDEELLIRERAVAREDAWRRRVDQHALALDPPGWLRAELGPVPTDPQERQTWRVAAAELDGYRRAYGLDDPGPAKHRWGRVARGGRPAAAARAAEAADGTRRRSAKQGRGERPHRGSDRGQPPTLVAGQRHQVDPDRLLGTEPRRQTSGRRRDWQAAQAALERLAGWSRHRHHRDQPHPDRADRDRPGAASTVLLAIRNAMAARRWQKGAAHGPAPQPRPQWGRTRAGGVGRALLPGHRPVGPCPDRRRAPAVPRRPRRPARPAAGQRLGRAGSTGPPAHGSLDTSGSRACVTPTPPGAPGPARHRQPGPPRPLRPHPLPAPPRRRAGRLDPQPDLAGTPRCRRRPDRLGAGRPGRPPAGRAGRPGRRRPGRLAAAVPPLQPGPGLAARRQRGAPHRAAAGPPRSRRLCELS
jgi:hypothetical protein